MRKIREIFTNLFLVAVAVIIFLLCFEIVVRSFLPVSDTLFQGDPIFGHKHIPNKKGKYIISEHTSYVRFNKEGFWDIDHELNNTKNRHRIFFLGDSFISGLEVNFNDTVHQVLKQSLDTSHPGEYEIFNFGIQRFSNANELLLFEEYSKIYTPNTVILGFVANNDIYDNCLENQHRISFFIENDKLKQRPFSPEIYSNFLLFVSEHLKSSLFIRKSIAQISEKYIHKEQYFSKHLQVYLNDYTNQTKSCWNVTFKILSKINNLSRILGSDFIILNINDKYVSDEEYRLNIINHYPQLSIENFNVSKPGLMLNEFCKENNITYIDLSNKYKDNYKNLHYPVDGHWNKEGHSVVANELYSYFS